MDLLKKLLVTLKKKKIQLIINLPIDVNPTLTFYSVTFTNVNKYNVYIV